MQLDQRVLDILEQNNYGIDDSIENFDGECLVILYERIDITPSSYGKTYWLIRFDGTTEGFIDGMYETACGFCIEDAIKESRKRYPNYPSDDVLIKRYKRKREHLFALYNLLNGSEPTNEELIVKKLKELTEYYFTLENDLMDARESKGIMDKIKDVAVDLLIDGTDMAQDELWKILDNRRK